MIADPKTDWGLGSARTDLAIPPVTSSLSTLRTSAWYSPTLAQQSMGRVLTVCGQLGDNPSSYLMRFVHVFLLITELDYRYSRPYNHIVHGIDYVHCIASKLSIRRI